MTRRIWTDSEDQFLRDYLDILSWQDCAEMLGRTYCSVINRVHKLGLHQSPTFRILLSMRYYPESARKYLFRKGITPWNKGKKGLIVSTEAMKKTQFKKGQLPVNTLHDGAISVRKDKRTGIQYKWTRLSLGKWDLLHRVVYKRQIGPIPKGMLVNFKDGDTLNCSPDNLYLIDRKTNMHRNTIHRYPDEVKSLIRTHAKFNKLLSQHGQK